MQMLPRTHPQNLDDLTVQVALVRPGADPGRRGPSLYRAAQAASARIPDYEIPYEHPLLEPVLEETLGTIVYQEQVIEVAMALAGFSAAEAEGLRRAMSRKRSQEAIEEHHDRFLVGAVGAKGCRSRWRSGSGSRSRASPASASRRRTRPPSGCSPTNRPGCACIMGPSSSARC